MFADRLMSMLAGFLWSSAIWLGLQIGLTVLASRVLGSLDPMLRRGIFLLSTTLATVIDFAFF
jgi:hypothetical protein